MSIMENDVPIILRLSDEQAKKMLSEISFMEKVARDLETLLMEENHVVGGKHDLSMNCVDKVISVTSAYLSRSIRMWSIAKSMYLSVSNNRRKVENSAYVRERSLKKDSRPTENDAKMKAASDAKDSIDEQIIWEQIVLRIAGIKDSFESVLNAAQQTAWIKNKEWNALKDQ